MFKTTENNQVTPLEPHEELQHLFLQRILVNIYFACPLLRWCLIQAQQLLHITQEQLIIRLKMQFILTNKVWL